MLVVCASRERAAQAAALLRVSFVCHRSVVRGEPAGQSESSWGTGDRRVPQEGVETQLGAKRERDGHKDSRWLC